MAALFALLKTPKLPAAFLPPRAHVDSGDQRLNQLQGKGEGY